MARFTSTALTISTPNSNLRSHLHFRSKIANSSKLIFKQPLLLQDHRLPTANDSAFTPTGNNKLGATLGAIIPFTYLIGHLSSTKYLLSNLVNFKPCLSLLSMLWYWVGACLIAGTRLCFSPFLALPSFVGPL